MSRTSDRRSRRRASEDVSDGGSATAEIAVALPALLLVLGLALSAVELGVAQVRCVDAARTAARLLARGDPPEVARSAALEAAPSGATVGVASVSGTVRVRVTAPRPALLAGWSGLPEPDAVAVAALEGPP